MPRYASPRRASPVRQRSQQKTEAKPYGALRNPNAAGVANPGLRPLGVGIREVMEELVHDQEFHAPDLVSLDTLGSTKGSALTVQAVLSARARLRATLTVAESCQSEGTSRTCGAVCSISRRNLRPTFWLILALTSELSRLLRRTLCFRKSTLPVRTWKHPDCVAWLVEHVGTQLQVTRESVGEHVETEFERLLSKSFVRRCPSWEAIRLRWPRAVATRLACQNPPRH